VPVLLVDEGEPVHQESQYKNDQCPFEYFSEHLPLRHGLKFLHGKTHGVAHGEQERWKDQVGRRKAMPGRVPQGRISKGLAAGRIDDYHETDGHAPENVERERTGRCSVLSHVLGNKAMKIRYF